MAKKMTGKVIFAGTGAKGWKNISTGSGWGTILLPYMTKPYPLVTLPSPEMGMAGPRYLGLVPAITWATALVRAKVSRKYK